MAKYGQYMRKRRWFTRPCTVDVRKHQWLNWFLATSAWYMVDIWQWARPDLPPAIPLPRSHPSIRIGRHNKKAFWNQWSHHKYQCLDDLGRFARLRSRYCSKFDFRCSTPLVPFCCFEICCGNIGSAFIWMLFYFVQLNVFKSYAWRLRASDMLHAQSTPREIHHTSLALA